MNLAITFTRAALVAGLITGGPVLSAFTSAPALAASGDALPQAAFSVRGVDFTSPQAVAHLKHRLDHIAAEICDPNSGGLHLLSADQRACYATARKDGLAQIDSRERQAMRDRAVRLADVANAAGSQD